VEKEKCLQFTVPKKTIAFVVRAGCSGQSLAFVFSWQLQVLMPWGGRVNSPATTFTISGRVTYSGTSNGIAGVRISLTGLGGISNSTTDSNGNYSFNAPGGGNYTVAAMQSNFDFMPQRISIDSLSSNYTTINFAGVPPPLLPVPRDDNFEAFTIDRSRWNLAVMSQQIVQFDQQVTVSQGYSGDPDLNGRLRIQPRSEAFEASFNGSVSAMPINLNLQNIVAVCAVRAAIGEQTVTSFAIGNDSNNYFRFVVTAASLTNLGPEFAALENQRAASPAGSGPMIVFQSKAGGVSTMNMAPYNAVTDQFWRFRYDAVNQIIFFETSADGIVWNVRLQQSRAGATLDSLISELIAGTFNATINPGLALFDNYSIAPPIGVRFAKHSFVGSETDGQISVTLTRPANQAETPLTVNYATTDGTALAGSDYTPVSGTLIFNVGELSKSFLVPVALDSIAEGTMPETFSVTLSSPLGGTLVGPPTATVFIADSGGGNPIDNATFFVTEQYLDFLGRSPDPGGLNYWAGLIADCGSNAACLNERRVLVSAAFFQAPEFFDTGGFLYRLYRISLARFPTYAEFANDQLQIISGPELAAYQHAFAERLVLRPEFMALYDTVNNRDFVDALYTNAGITPTENDRTFLILSLQVNSLTRAQVLLFIVNQANSDSGFNMRESNRLFVLMQYLGYLRRDPDSGGFNFWLGILNQTGNVPGMVCAFITSAEYQQRFGSAITRSNADCSAFF
jgi:hypothetical protein